MPLVMLLELFNFIFLASKHRNKCYFCYKKKKKEKRKEKGLLMNKYVINPLFLTYSYCVSASIGRK
jgi:hypothetical protein